MNRIVCFSLAAVAALCLAGTALAHGPTVHIRDEGFDPPTLRLEAGETVHFDNHRATPVRVRGDDDAFHSPELAPNGGGWHMRLPFPGRFGYALDGEPDVRGVLLVEEAGR